jgi:hypothetical protein
MTFGELDAPVALRRRLTARGGRRDYRLDQASLFTYRAFWIEQRNLVQEKDERK